MEKEEQIALIKKRLIRYGITRPDEDRIRFALLSTSVRIKNFINQDNVPHELDIPMCEESVGKYLIETNFKGVNTEAFEGVISVKKVGDTSITFDTSVDPSVKLQQHAESLRIPNRVLYGFRSLVW